MSRGPLEVLSVLRRDAAHAEAYRLVHGYADGTLAEAVHESREAIAQVEALAEAMRDIESMQPGTPTMDMRAKVGDPKAIAYRYQRVAREALAPFTPGQDSEGGHGR